MKIYVNFTNMKVKNKTPNTIIVNCSAHVNGVEQLISLEYNGPDLTFLRGTIHPEFIECIKYIFNNVFGYAPFKNIPKQKSLYMVLNTEFPEESTYS